MILQFTVCALIALLTWRWLRSTKPVAFGIDTSESRWAMCLNTIIHDIPLIPTWLRVYAIGVVDTITTVLWRRGLLGKSIDATQVINKFGKEKNKMCIITGSEKHTVSKVQELIRYRWRFRDRIGDRSWAATSKI